MQLNQPRIVALLLTAICAAACSDSRPPYEDGAGKPLDVGRADSKVRDSKAPLPGDLRPDRPVKPPPRDQGTPPPDKGPPPPDKPQPKCPPQMVQQGKTCVDRYEAPNKAGQYPLVMYNYPEALAWCQARGKRLCYDDEWTAACAGPSGFKYPYGNTHSPGKCTDNKTWKLYQQSKLSSWPKGVAGPNVTSLSALLAAAKAKGGSAAVAADHVQWLYQADPSGAKKGCVGATGAHDLCGNVEEWTTRRDGGKQYFHGNLKGRYWSEARTCQSGVKSHGDLFRFYEIGFRCCKDQAP